MEFVGFKLEDAIRIEWRKNGNKGRFRIYIFNCSICNNEIKSKKSYFIKHSGLCITCSSKNTIKLAQEQNRLKPFEARYNIFKNKIKDEPIKTDVTYEVYLEFTKIKNCTYCDKFMNWLPYDNNPGFWLDRKDNNKYHTKDNLTVCCGDCNKTKRDFFTYEEFMILKPGLIEIQLKRNS